MANGWRPLTVLRWKPRLALALVTPGDMFGFDRAGATVREERARLIEASAEQAEIRAQNHQVRVVTESELCHWLKQRNRHFDVLSQRGLAGGSLRFQITTPLSKEAE